MAHTTTDLFECAQCEDLFPSARIQSVTTSRATRYEPADGFNVCDECFQALEDADEAAAERAAEERAEREMDREYDEW